MSLADRLDERPIGASQKFVLILMLVLLMVEGLDLQLLGLVAPVVVKEWGIDRAAFGPAMGAALLGLALGCGIGGPLGDRFGRKRVLLVSAVIFAVGTTAAALSHNVAQLAAIRFASGLGFGAASPVTIALVAEWLPRRFQPTAVALITVGTPFGGMIGSGFLVFLIPVLGWRGCFIACGVLTMMLTLLVFLALPDSPVHLAARGRIDEALRLVRRHVDPTLTEVDVLPNAADAGQIDRPGAKDRVFDRKFLRLTVGSWLLFFAAQFIAYSIISWTTTMLTMTRFPLLQALQGAFSFNLCAVLATLATGPLVRRIGSKRIILGASVMTLACLVLLQAALGAAGDPPDERSYWLVVLANAGIGIFISACMAAGYAMVAMGYTESVRATGIGISLMIGRVGGVLTGYFGGVLLSLAGEETYPMTGTLIALSLVALAGGLIVDRHIIARARTN